MQIILVLSSSFSHMCPISWSQLCPKLGHPVSYISPQPGLSARVVQQASQRSKSKDSVQDPQDPQTPTDLDFRANTPPLLVNRKTDVTSLLAPPYLLCTQSSASSSYS